MKKKAFFIGRFAPPHKGHIEAIMNLTKEFDEVVIGLGSCYEVGSPRHPFLAIFRERMILLSLYRAGCDMNKIKILHVQDFKTFEEWIGHILRATKKEKITHFVTGNQDDILAVLKDKNIELPFEFINPEIGSTVPWHASDLRQAIKDGNYQKFLEIAAEGTIELMGSVDGFNGIREILEEEELYQARLKEKPVTNDREFFKGRQTADVVVTVSEKKISPDGRIYYDDYVLCGVRPENKAEFKNWLGLPGDAIREFESPINTAIRALKQKAKVESKILENKFEPAHVLLKTAKGNVIANLAFLKLYNSKDQKLAGKKGGSSQCFHLALTGNVAEYTTMFKDTKALSNIKFMPIEQALKNGLAYEQTQMVKTAMKRLNH